MASKRHNSGSPTEETDKMTIRPLGAGQEVGRSCHYLEFKDKKILLDCGIHPGTDWATALFNFIFDDLFSQNGILSKCILVD